MIRQETSHSAGWPHHKDVEGAEAGGVNELEQDEKNHAAGGHEPAAAEAVQPCGGSVGQPLSSRLQEGPTGVQDGPMLVQGRRSDGAVHRKRQAHSQASLAGHENRHDLPAEAGAGTVSTVAFHWPATGRLPVGASAAAWQPRPPFRPPTMVWCASPMCPLSSAIARFSTSASLSTAWFSRRN